MQNGKQMIDRLSAGLSRRFTMCVNWSNPLKAAYKRQKTPAVADLPGATWPIWADGCGIFFIICFYCVVQFGAAAAMATPRADVYFLGEIHDNPTHHAVQAQWVQRIAPKALVFEMIPAPAADAITPAMRFDQSALQAHLAWQDSGWPDFAMYWPIFTAAPDAQIYGAALPRDQARAAFGNPIAQVFGADAGRFGLDQSLPADQQAAREALQFDAHCGKLPAALLPQMVDVQRLRDGYLARAALRALADHGAPVVVITGNGHARRDWGAPVSVGFADPSVRVFTLGQSEMGQIEGEFDLLQDAPAVDRADPCAAFD